MQGVASSLGLPVQTLHGDRETSRHLKRVKGLGFRGIDGTYNDTGNDRSITHNRGFSERAGSEPDVETDKTLMDRASDKPIPLNKYSRRHTAC